MLKNPKRINISSGAPWEATVGYSRAVRIGDRIEVAGTTAMRDGEPQYKDEPYQQTRLVLDIIQKAIEEAGASLGDVVRTRIYITDLAHWQEVAKAHGEFFRDIRPAATMVVVKALIDPALLVEIEALAIA
ncbi:MAG: RidA family protein [Bacteroidia bacterium]